MKILILGSHHGDEYSGEKLYNYIERNRPHLLDYVDYLVANPRARRRNVRYIESDMNRSYNGLRKTYEERRATKVLRHINESGYDLVLDMHTTSCDQPPSLIMASINPQNERFIQASSIQHLVIMESKTVSSALNGVCPKSVAIEINQNITNSDLHSLASDIERYVDRVIHRGDKYIYEVDLLRNSEVTEEELDGLRNFERSKLGFYPVLVGENSYQKQGYDYLGFKALTREKYRAKAS